MFQQQKILRLIKGLMISYVISCAFLLILAMAVWKWNLSEMMINGAMLFVYIISVIVGGFYLGKKQREKKFVWGLILGIFYIALLFLTSAFMHGTSGWMEKSTFAVAIICILGGMLGGMVA